MRRAAFGQGFERSDFQEVMLTKSAARIETGDRRGARFSLFSPLSLFKSGVADRCVGGSGGRYYKETGEAGERRPAANIVA